MIKNGIIHHVCLDIKRSFSPMSSVLIYVMSCLHHVFFSYGCTSCITSDGVADLMPSLVTNH